MIEICKAYASKKNREEIEYNSAEKRDCGGNGNIHPKNGIGQYHKSLYQYSHFLY